MIEYLIDRRITDVIDKFKSAKPRERVRRFHSHAQEGERVFDVSGFGKLDPSKFAKRNAVLAQFYFQVERMRAGTEQHGDFADRHALLAQLFNAFRDETRLLVFVARADHDRYLTAFYAREQAFFVALLNV